MSESVQNIRQSHEHHKRRHDNLERGINWGRTHFYRGQNSVRHLSVGLPLATIICKSNDVTHLHDLGNAIGSTNLQNQNKT